VRQQALDAGGTGVQTSLTLIVNRPESSVVQGIDVYTQVGGGWAVR
jgi:hypothetical protein